MIHRYYNGIGIGEPGICFSVDSATPGIQAGESVKNT